MSTMKRLHMIAAFTLALPATACAVVPEAAPPGPTSSDPMTTSTASPSTDRPANGAYSGRIDHLHQHVSLQIRPDGSVRLVVLHNLHLPPAEVETLEARLVERDGAWCLDPTPRTIAPCLSIERNAPGVGVTHLASGERIVLGTVDPAR